MKIFKREKTVGTNKSLLEKAWEIQKRIEARRERIGKGKYGRVLKMARKPTSEEYWKTAKITGAGILLIGGIGFAIFLIAAQVAPWVAKALGLI